MVPILVNRFNLVQKNDINPDPERKPRNAHGNKLFLIKLQLAPDNMLIYDRQRTFQVYFLKDKNPVIFRKFQREMEGPRGGYYGRKMYRWAKRTGDWELSVCLDKEPQEEIKW